MKRLAFVFLALLLSILAGCTAEEKPVPTREVEDDCYLCGGGIKNLVPSYWGQKNVAFISLNTFDIVPLEINRYDKITGHPIEEYLGAVSFEGGKGADGGFSARMQSNYDRGFADGTLDFYSDEILDIDKASAFLCSDCLNNIVKPTCGPYFGVGLINLETREIRLLEKHLIGFGLGDYYISCNLREQKDGAPLQMNLLIVYCPIRYKHRH